MNCQEFWSQAPRSSGIPSASWSAHLAQCQNCAAAWSQQQNVSAGLRRLAAEWSQIQAPARVEQRMMDAFRGRATFEPAVFRPRRPWLGMLTWASAAAAVLVLAISLVHVREPQTIAPHRLPGNSVILAKADPRPGNAVPSEYDGSADNDGTVADNGFVPLPNVEPLAPNEEGDVVRLELPRSVMMELGYDISPDQAGEPVQAEVLYGPDGVARAVRFLDDTF
jgi:hypothetical protein